MRLDVLSKTPGLDPRQSRVGQKAWAFRPLGRTRAGRRLLKLLHYAWMMVICSRSPSIMYLMPAWSSS